MENTTEKVPFYLDNGTVFYSENTAAFVFLTPTEPRSEELKALFGCNYCGWVSFLSYIEVHSSFKDKPTSLAEIEEHVKKFRSFMTSIMLNNISLTINMPQSDANRTTIN